MIFSVIIIWAKATFFFEQLFPGVARTWWTSRSEFFLGPKSRFISHIGINFSTFRSGVTGWPVKKSSSSPLWGHRLPVTALALSARRLFGPASRAGWITITCLFKRSYCVLWVLSCQCRVSQEKPLSVHMLSKRAEGTNPCGYMCNCASVSWYIRVGVRYWISQENILFLLSIKVWHVQEVYLCWC